MNEILAKEKKLAYNIAFLFTLMGALMIVLSPLFFGPMLGIIFIIPIYIGLNGIKARKKIGYYMALGLVPLTLSVSIMWIKYYFSLDNITVEIKRISESMDISSNIVKFIINGSFYGSILELIITICTFILLIKYNKIFKTVKKGT